MSQTKREQVIGHIRYLREELREMHLGIKEDNLFPEPGELRGLMAQLEALLELIEGNTKIQTMLPTEPLILLTRLALGKDHLLLFPNAFL